MSSGDGMPDIARCVCGEPEGHTGWPVCVYGGSRSATRRLTATDPAEAAQRIFSLEAQLAGAVAAFNDFVAEVAAPTGRLRLEDHPEAHGLYLAVRRARDTVAKLRGQ